MASIKRLPERLEVTAFRDTLQKLSTAPPAVVAQAQQMMSTGFLRPTQSFKNAGQVNQVIDMARNLDPKVAAELLSTPALTKDLSKESMKWIELAAQREPKDWINWHSATLVVAQMSRSNPAILDPSGQIVPAARDKVLDQIGKHAYLSLTGTRYQQAAPQIATNVQRDWNAARESLTEVTGGQRAVSRFVTDAPRIDISLGGGPSGRDISHDQVVAWLGEGQQGWAHPVEAAANQLVTNIITPLLISSAADVAEFLEREETMRPTVVGARVELTANRNAQGGIESITVVGRADAFRDRNALQGDRATLTCTLRPTPTGDFELVDFQPSITPIVRNE
jgi:hypothetical protein